MNSIIYVSPLLHVIIKKSVKMSCSLSKTMYPFASKILIFLFYWNLFFFRCNFLTYKNLMSKFHNIPSVSVVNQTTEKLCVSLSMIKKCCCIFPFGFCCVRVRNNYDSKPFYRKKHADSSWVKQPLLQDIVNLLPL